MAIVINGSGTVTGLAVGGLPDGTVDAGTLATDAVTAAKIATNSVDSAELVDGAVDAAHLASGVGGILQIVESTNTTETISAVANTWLDCSPSASITPSSTGSKIMVFLNANMYIVNSASDVGYNIRMSRAISGGSTSYPASLSGGSNGHESLAYHYEYSGGSTAYTQYHSTREIITGVDSPSTTSAVTYKLQMRGYSADTLRNNKYGQTQITLIEVSG